LPKIDTTRFQYLIAEIPESQFPDKINIFIKGMNVPEKKEKGAKVAQSVVEVTPGLSAADPEKLYELKIINESNFSTTVAGKKIAKLDIPFNLIKSISAWAQRSDIEDSTPVNVTMYVTTQNNQASTDGIWTSRFTLSQQPLTPTYLIDFLANGTPIGQIGQMIGTLVGQAASVLADLLMPTLPSPKALASKFLGPAAAPVQQALALLAQQYAKVKPYIDLAVQIAEAVVEIITAIAEGDEEKLKQILFKYLPPVLTFLFELIPEQALVDAGVYQFKG
jgi:hypothetical protein